MPKFCVMQEADTFVTPFKFQNIVHVHKERMVYYRNLTCGKNACSTRS